MTFEQYMAEIRSINEQLQDISNKTANQALANCANSSNPLFVDLMRRQADLTLRSHKLTEKMMEQLDIEK
ncbi:MULTISPECIES: hypothetical protein [Enterobacter cloacae complex]|jgi:hypothetical protein|uniref:Uncharacterized protein n=1 Tax=Enterobacter asburiae TaxID=61645 RepID=A0A8I1FY55_ENTAS|nr:hypothetical protein [Enterobacter asburiae]MBJ6594165.1 hypothetical protein [Enterobacter asburiae]HCM9310900.1 hypothetical protein [Enterobacter kobei]